MSHYSFLNECRRLLAVRVPLVWVETFEEDRLERQLKLLAEKGFSRPVPLFVRRLSTGLVPAGSQEKNPATSPPAAALEELLASEDTVLAIFEDLHPHLADPEVVRRLRDLARKWRDRLSALFVVGPELSIPKELDKSVEVLEFPLPTAEELSGLLDRILAAGTVQVAPEIRRAMVQAAAGLTEEEATRAFGKVLLGKETFTEENLAELYEEKRQIVRRSGILDFVPPTVRIQDIGGLGKLKEWLRLRRRFLTKQARDLGIALPKGILLTGVSGCGKSIAVQAVSSYWQLPMVRLDMNRVYGYKEGPEVGLARAIETAEAVSPCVLWIDEIETAIVGMGGDPTGLATRIFSSFLTWMQEKKKLVFVAATANEIHMLPPELLRKGRFDEIFFVDLPSEADRAEIFRVHLQRRGLDPDRFPITNLAKATSNFTGAEIEHVVVSAVYRAFDEDRPVEPDDLYVALGNTVPLATTMAEKIKEIRRWADQRAVRAS